MSYFSALVVVGLLTAPPAPPTVVRVPVGLSAAASREVSRLVRSLPRETPRSKPSATQPKEKGWIARHPRLFGALAGFGAGCAVGASQVGGSQDNFFNALDEAACPVVGGIGAAAGALVGSLVK
jgi:hypothetical protein